MSDRNLKEYPPGSDKARKAGCKCPVMDNHYGAGFRKDDHGESLFWISGDCPIHHLEKLADDQETD